MNNRPEKTTNAEGEEKDEGKEPGKAELHRPKEAADKAKNETDNPNYSTKQGQTGKAAIFKKLAFRRGHDVGWIAHFFGTSAGLAGSAFFSKSAT
jgi:hypothetical protein